MYKTLTFIWFQYVHNLSKFLPVTIIGDRVRKTYVRDVYSRVCQRIIYKGYTHERG